MHKHQPDLGAPKFREVKAGEGHLLSNTRLRHGQSRQCWRAPRSTATGQRRDAVVGSEMRQRGRAVRTREEHVVLDSCHRKGPWGLLTGKLLSIRSTAVVTPKISSLISKFNQMIVLHWSHKNITLLFLWVSKLGFKSCVVDSCAQMQELFC